MHLTFVRCLGLTSSIASLSACSAAHEPAPAPVSGTVTTVAATAATLPAAPRGMTTADGRELQTPELGHPVITDASLSAALTRAVASDAVLRRQSIQVSVDHGAVALRGTVKNLAAKERAAALVDSFRGATALSNQLVVEAPPRPDADVAQDVRQVLQYDVATRRAHAQVSVFDDVVTLRGPVPSVAQRRLLQQEASRVKGVKEVLLAFASPSTPRVEARVEAEVNAALADDARLEGTHVLVAVHGARVQLSGMVGSLAEREAAIDDAHVAGVADVNTDTLNVDWNARDQARAAQPWSAPADAHLADAVKRDLEGDARIGSPLPTVTVEHGVVMLSGAVADFRSESAAVNDTNSVHGVRRTDDRMTVVPAQRESDSAIQGEVERTLLNDLETPDAPHLQVTTQGGKVTLRGNVFSQEERSLVESDAEDVPGVIGVEDDLAVQGYGAETHASPSGTLRTRVVERIFWDARLDSRHITTQTSPNGDVTLQGTVSSAAEARAAVQDATQAGAAHVIDHLTTTAG